MRRGKIEGAVVYMERDEETVRIVSARWATKRETDLSSIPASLGVTTTWNSTRSAGRTKGSMGRQAAVVLYVLALVAVVVGVDVLFFRNRLWERLMVNVGIVLVFWAFYLRFLKRP